MSMQTGRCNGVMGLTYGLLLASSRFFNASSPAIEEVWGRPTLLAMIIEQRPYGGYVRLGTPIYSGGQSAVLRLTSPRLVYGLSHVHQVDWDRRARSVESHRIKPNWSRAH